MMKLKWWITFAALAGSLFMAPAFASHVLKPEHRRLLDTWLKQHPTLRLATDKDCGDCQEDIQTLRHGQGGVWKPVPHYHPYVVTGDFNTDGETDFAVGLVDTSKTTNAFVLAIFNGPFGTDGKTPAYLSANLDLKGQGLFFGPPRSKPYHLILGFFATEGVGFEPRNETYDLLEYSHY